MNTLPSLPSWSAAEVELNPGSLALGSEPQTKLHCQNVHSINPRGLPVTDLGRQVWVSFLTFGPSCARRLVIQSHVSYPAWLTAKKNEAIFFFSIKENTSPVPRQNMASGGN